ncbi:hypothetical protein RN001_001994 [Aquatica leii]|uniref:separase n=1 Tax=Aquatica leii TaxID=1421715 RepID=A0AAN7QN75_9COLE|nr:hypothetical protein RN001_001994 [Aquatica leii]
MSDKEYEDEPNEIKKEVEEILKKIQNIHYPSGPIYSKSNKIGTHFSVEENELEKIYHLVETHSPNLRFNAIHRFEKSVEEADFTQPLNKSYIDFQCTTKNMKDRIDVMLQQLNEMPEEWTMIQITSQLNVQENFEVTSERYFTNSIHITVFNCGSKELPFSLMIDPPLNKVNGDVLEIRQEMYSIIKDNVKCLENFKAFCGKSFKHAGEKLLYSEMRFSLNNRLEVLVKEIQSKWLREWRCLLIGKFLNMELEDIVQTKVDTLNISEKKKNLLKCLIKGSGFLSITEMKNGLSYIFPENSDKDLRVSLAKEIQQMQGAFEFVKQTRHPVLLIIDEKLDVLPWEMLDVLENHPASRMPCLHFTYALFKEYENNIKDGMVSVTAENGTYLINPGLDLKNMENRLKNFFNYWLPDWKGLVGVTPTEDDFKNLLTTGDIFIYSGHGNGTQFFASEKIQRMRINKVVLLFGCSSVSLSTLGPQIEMFGSYQMYLIACSPCIVGMLWPVTDIDTDIVTTEFLSQWIPSKAETHWKLIEKKKWETSGNLTVNKTKATLTNSEKHEPELLRALCKGKKVAKQFLMKAACVARGLPVKLK